MAETLKKSGEIQDVLAQACARRELLILATPYLRFESSFLAIQNGELHILATMSREDATFGLRAPDITIRFPDGLGFYEARVEVLGLGILDGRRTVRLSLPRTLVENDQRDSYRVERVGRVVVTYSTVKGDLLQGSLVDISATGAKVHAQRDVDPATMGPGTVLLLSIPLSPEIQIETRAEVRHLGARTLGLAFRPALPERTEQPLSRWIFLRREEERERLAQRLELNERAAQPKPAGPTGILLVSSDPALETALREALAPVQPVIRLPYSAQAIKDALAAAPPLAIFHVRGTGLDERRLLKALVELALARIPVLLLGTQVDGSTLFELSAEWKASSAIVWNPSRALFLQRLAQGIIRRHSHGGDSPMAPAEA
ncbi:PilZ domain-containing protein [Mesoterricola silvestris]|uniref:PilZ domain-containing protein n=1 Tax=Mesoterricola silvestris TaxID=2927979 RepID=A0AA48GF13_9BACT|nr:PilZ domain-containing protein [Mesoterricola silvestris]BDU71366.1 hypothetical protein METEAL_05400 [Mesoterricola silvestris]